MPLFDPLPSGQALLLRSHYREMHLYMGWVFHKKCGSARVFVKSEKSSNQEILHRARNWQERGSTTGSKGHENCLHNQRGAKVFLRFVLKVKTFRSPLSQFVVNTVSLEKGQGLIAHHAVMFSGLNL